MVKTTLSESQISADLKALEKIVLRLANAGVKQRVLSHAWSTSVYKAYGIGKTPRPKKSEAALAEQKRIQDEAIAEEVERLRKEGTFDLGSDQERETPQR